MDRDIKALRLKYRKKAADRFDPAEQRRQIDEMARAAREYHAGLGEGPFRYTVRAESTKGRKVEFEVVAKTKDEAQLAAERDIRKHGMRPSAITHVIFIGPV
jgi:hypothetical protein